MKKGVRIVKMTIYLPEDVHRELRHVSFDEGKPTTAIVQKLIEEYLAKRKKRKGVK